MRKILAIFLCKAVDKIVNDKFCSFFALWYIMHVLLISERNYNETK